MQARHVISPADRCRAAGFAYIAVLVLAAIGATAVTAAVQVWHTAQRQEKERQLLFVGHEYRQALERYARNAARNGPRAPLRLEDLLLDPRVPGVQRYLRRIYPDPITGSTEWGLVKSAGGEIYGVYSLSQDVPLKKANFAVADKRFEGAGHYADWVFMPSSSSTPITVHPANRQP